MLIGMSAGVPMIDLDLASPHAPAEPRPLGRRLTAARPVLGLAALALAWTCLVASAPRPAPMIEVMRAGGHAASAFELGPDALYIAQYGDSWEGQSVLHAYRL